jgi:glycine cleavage system aminomethyltransferase T
LGKQIALGFVKRGFQEPGTRLEARPADSAGGTEAITVQIAMLPFV